MVIGNAYNKDELAGINIENGCFKIVDKDLHPEKFKKSILLGMSTKDAREIRDYLISQIEEEPDDMAGIGLLIHTGSN